jgi:hypothetical protein
VIVARGVGGECVTGAVEDSATQRARVPAMMGEGVLLPEDAVLEGPLLRNLCFGLWQSALRRVDPKLASGKRSRKK